MAQAEDPIEAVLARASAVVLDAIQAGLPLCHVLDGEL
jgi:hypothetical protein